MKKVVLLGDSIRLIGYGKYVPELLGEDYEVWQPEDNCRFSAYTLRMLHDFRTELQDADIIHWNNGHWDSSHCFEDGSFTPLNVYVDNMKRIATHLLKITDKVIFATTTPTRNEAKYDKNETVCKYNAAIVPVLKEMGIHINDLNSLVAPDVYKYICDDCLHLSDEGAMLCAKQVAEVIKSIDK